MLEVSDKAAAYLKNVLSQSDVPDNACVRLSTDGNQLQLVLDQAQDQDKTFDHEGETVLALDSELAESLDGRSLDLEEQGQESKLVLT